MLRWLIAAATAQMAWRLLPDGLNWTLNIHSGSAESMSPDNKAKLAERVVRAAETALEAKGYVSSLDVVVGIGWLDMATVKRWRQGQIRYLERVMQSNLPRISAAMKLFRGWAAAKGLRPSVTKYVTHTKHRQPLRFSASGDHTIERLYSTHWVSPVLAEKKRERLAEQAQRADAASERPAEAESGGFGAG